LDRKGAAQRGKAFSTTHRWDLEWQDDADILSLGYGVQVKVLYEDRERQHADMLVKFPPGYVEPLHNHDGSYSIIVLGGPADRSGRATAPGRLLLGQRRGAPWTLRVSGGLLVFASFRGPSAKHRFEGSLAGEI
jgi:hypothetical protein